MSAVSERQIDELLARAEAGTITPSERGLLRALRSEVPSERRFHVDNAVDPPDDETRANREAFERGRARARERTTAPPGSIHDQLARELHTDETIYERIEREAR